jgi:hypothetical protein
MTDLTPTHEMLENEVESKSMGLASTVTLHYPVGTLKGTLTGAECSLRQLLPTRIRDTSIASPEGSYLYHWSVM